MSTLPIRILGVDPGLRRTGWGVVASEGTRLSFLAAGVIAPPETLPLGQRLAALHAALTAVIVEHAPHEAAVEETFVNANARATLKLGQARGVAMLVPALAGLDVAEYAPNLVKKTVVGAGHAEKRQIQAMIAVLLPSARVAGADAADALAIAICHAQHRGVRALALKVSA
ncbi:crossover junction endodeoxyribonuclease RuvC [Hansschlegelia zhihuaiae]|uniref:Crossover junction endodeoxyribonuclease RuvC n=1 Tax=Hansschlegelia zhihuaiae TaxID=405005 RepID=A0A4Q0MJ70_9HYPH|nr:crossover junction endodeoxyribonuclease RuvC [Hansschlegelia zhihuaiae]RXF73485.1 crossover junction endodeoxyribonuclease RuvC [Hansschlegelia zhihuaiae]